MEQAAFISERSCEGQREAPLPMTLPRATTYQGCQGPGTLLLSRLKNRLTEGRKFVAVLGLKPPSPALISFHFTQSLLSWALLHLQKGQPSCQENLVEKKNKQNYKVKGCLATRKVGSCGFATGIHLPFFRVSSSLGIL